MSRWQGFTNGVRISIIRTQHGLQCLNLKQFAINMSYLFLSYQSLIPCLLNG
jgi:hypothetical protein